MPEKIINFFSKEGMGEKVEDKKEKIKDAVMAEFKEDSLNRTVVGRSLDIRYVVGLIVDRLFLDPTWNYNSKGFIAETSYQVRQQVRWPTEWGDKVLEDLIKLVVEKYETV